MNYSDSNLSDLLNDLGITHDELSDIFDHLIKNKTRGRNIKEIQFRLGSYKIEKNNCNKECSICLETIKQGEHKRELECGHYFHRKCIDKWFKEGNYCPYCRFNYFE